MVLTIADGKGTGSLAEVANNLLQTMSVSHDALFHHSRLDGDAYAWASGTYDYGAADTILLVKNTSTTKRLHISRIDLSGDTDTRAVIHIPTSEVTVAGTTITGLNLNTASGNVAAASARRDETGNSQGNVIWSGEIHAAQNPVTLDLFGAVILGTNVSLGIDYVTDGAACDVTIIGYYLEPP